MRRQRVVIILPPLALGTGPERLAFLEGTSPPARRRPTPRVKCRWIREDQLPTTSLTDGVLLAISSSKISELQALRAAGRNPFPIAQMVSQAVSDRLTLAGLWLKSGDALISSSQFRVAISRHYYAMYHAARAITFGVNQGDDFERHSDLPRHLPPSIDDPVRREGELTAARLLRNQADYDPYPAGHADWEADARQLAPTAAEFVQACEDTARLEGHI